MTFNLDLGTEVFSSASSDLDLALHASAIISTPPGTWNPWSTESFQEALTAGNIRVENDVSLQIHLHISFDAELESCILHSGFVSQLGDTLCRSKFWSELGLEAFPAGDIDNPHHYPPITHISLNLCKSHRSAPALKAPRIPAALQNPCDAPPVDICPTVFLSTIHVRLEYTRPRLHNCQPFSLFSVIPLEPDQMYTYQLQPIEKDWEAFHCLIPEIDIHPGPSHLNSPQELSTLLNTALTTFIVGESTQSCRRGSQSQKQALIPLSQIAPSIFTRGYRQSLNQRAQFIPSIAKSLTSIIKHSRDPKLQDKAIRFQRSGEPEPETEPGVHNNTHAHAATMSLKSKLKTSLWRVAANQIHTTQSSRKRSLVVLVPTPNAEKDDEHSFEDELQFDAISLEDAICSQETGISENGQYSDRYLGTDEEGSVSGETDASALPTKDDGCSDHWEDLFSYGYSEMGQEERPYKTMSISEDSGQNHSQEIFSDCLKYLESPLLSDASALFESETFEEGYDKMLCE